MVTIYKDIFSKEPHYISIDKALERIRTGVSKAKVQQIREQVDKERANNLKCNLPSVCFSGKFGKDRTDGSLTEHSGFMVLDFDNVQDPEFRKEEMARHKFVKAAWVSPGGNGIKVLIKIADGKKHRQHFEAVRAKFPQVDKSGINVSRVCYESADELIYIAKDCSAFTDIVETTKVQVTERVEDGIFSKLLKWLSNSNNAFAKGERNTFTFKLACACCRFGMHEEDCFNNFRQEFGYDNEFTEREARKAIESAYRQNKNNFGSAAFERERLVEKKTHKEVEISADVYDLTIRPKDVIFGEDVKQDALQLYRTGYEQLKGIDIPALDEHFKLKKGEITLLSGIGNYGKTTFLFWTLLMRVLKYDERFAFFSPENHPPHEFYADFVEMIAGQAIVPSPWRTIDEASYSRIYDYVSKRIFYVYPKDIAPSPDYIKERFLELVIKEKISGCIIDPFNQMANDYNGSGGRTDKYLETFLSDCSRFAQNNNVYFLIVAHPKLMRKEPDGNYPCPDVFDIADGAMWNNKMDNILIYHRPDHQTDPTSPRCQLHMKKIRRQKSVGKKGIVDFNYNRLKRRYEFDGGDYMQELVKNIAVPEPEDPLERDTVPF